MATTPAPSPKKSLQYYMRAIHRVLGYLAIGMVVVYALSGIVLIHRTGDFMKTSTQVTTTLQPGLDAAQVGAELKIRNFKAIDETADQIVFAGGTYDKTTGQAQYAKKQLVAPLDKFVDLHKLPDAKNPHIALVTTIFGIVLFLLALTSLFMYKPKSKQFIHNMIYTSVGIIITVILVLFV